MHVTTEETRKLSPPQKRRLLHPIVTQFGPPGDRGKEVNLYWKGNKFSIGTVGTDNPPVSLSDALIWLAKVYRQNAEQEIDMTWDDRALPEFLRYVASRLEDAR